jgi:hypothetical protein
MTDWFIDDENEKDNLAAIWSCSSNVINNNNNLFTHWDLSQRLSILVQQHGNNTQQNAKHLPTSW